MEKILYREGFTAEELPNEVIERIKGVSYKENPYVKPGDLAYLRVRYYDFEHKVQSGELIVARKLALEVLDIFYELFEGGYEIEKIRLVEYLLRLRIDKQQKSATITLLSIILLLLSVR